MTVRRPRKLIWKFKRKKFNPNWKASGQTRKQRKYIANAPLHRKRKMIASNLSKELRKKLKQRSEVLKKGDKVKIMRGEFTGKEGKILEIITKQKKVIIEGIQRKKQDSSKVNIKMQPSNLQIIELASRENKTESKINKPEEKK